MKLSEHHADSHYIDWDDKISHLFGASMPEGWEESDRGPEYVRFTDGDHVVHFARLKTLTGTLFVVQVPDGFNDAETVHQGRDEAIARNNALAEMME